MQPFSHSRALIVDDQYTARGLLTHIFEAIGFAQVVACHDGRTALEHLQAQPFDIALIDVNLDGESGLQLVRAIRNIDQLRSLRVLMATASRDHEVARSAKHFGADDFLLKPFSINVMRDRLQRLFPGVASSSVALIDHHHASARAVR